MRIRVTVAAAAMLPWALACSPAPGGRDAGTDGADPQADEGSTRGDDTGAPSAFGPEERFELRLAEQAVPPLSLEMNRDEVAELFGDRADEVLLLEVDSTALLTHTLDAVKSACGESWRLDDQDPNHDCSLTALGSSFSGPDGTWQTSAEFAMVRILTMTPANVVLEGTSSEALQAIADLFEIGGGYGQILADGLGIARTDAIVPTGALVRAFQEDFVASHPAIAQGAKLPLYLEDALTDLETMTTRLGPMGDHPGLVDPAVPIHGRVFADDFQMRVVADSNLRLADGVDADGGKGFISVISDHTGPTFDDALEFDFVHADRFSITGVLDDLRVDMRFAVQEHDAFVWSCLGNPPCHENLPGAPVTAGSVWALEPWELEQTVAHAAFFAYEDLTYSADFLLGTAGIDIGQNGDPPGWVQYDVPIVGPEPQYLWETILEVGQVALHDTPYNHFDEGAADIAFTVREIPIGLTGAEAADAVRPYLQEQSSDLSTFILGDYKKNNDRVDFYYLRGENGDAYLFFVGESDMREGEAYDYPTPGFFEDPGLGTKISKKQVVGMGDTAHEKLQIDSNETTVYFSDEAGTTYRMRVVPTGSEGGLEVFVAQGVD